MLNYSSNRGYGDIRYSGWLYELERRAPNARRVLVATKTDLPRTPMNSTDEGELMARFHGARYVECSTVSGEGVDIVLREVSTWAAPNSLLELNFGQVYQAALEPPFRRPKVYLNQPFGSTNREFITLLAQALWAKIRGR